MQVLQDHHQVDPKVLAILSKYFDKYSSDFSSMTVMFFQYSSKEIQQTKLIYYLIEESKMNKLKRRETSKR